MDDFDEIKELKLEEDLFSYNENLNVNKVKEEENPEVVIK